MKFWSKSVTHFGYELIKWHWIFSIALGSLIPLHGCLELILFHVKQKELIWNPFQVKNKMKILKKKQVDCWE